MLQQLPTLALKFRPGSGILADRVPMRVLAVTQIFPNAAEPLWAPFNRQQFAALARRCDVEVLATIPWFPGAAIAARWSAAGRLTDVPRTEEIDGLPVTHPRVLYLPRFGHPLSAALYATSVLPDLLRRRGRFDVILGSWAYPDGAAVVALAHALGVPSVVKLHGSDMDVLATRPALRAQLRLALPRATRVVAVSRSLAAAARELGVAEDRIDVIRNGVDGSLFRVRDRAGARAELTRGGDTRPWILYVGRLEEEKGALDLAAAFARLAASHPDAVLVLLGDGRARAAAEAELRPLGDRVLFLGSRPLAEVPVWMAGANLVTLPSHHEGTPNVLLEALACGRRVVATRVGGIPDVVHREELGLLVPVRDRDALAGALRAVLEAPYDQAAVAALGAGGGWEESAGKLYESLVRATEGEPLAGEPLTPTLSPRTGRGGTEGGVKLAPPRRAPTLRSRARAAAIRALPRRLLVRRGGGAARRVALTFDDGPHQMTDAYLDVLDRYGARATFFVVGKACAEHPEAAARMAARGHEVAGHGFTHRAFTKLEPDTLRDELDRTTALLPAPRTSRPLVRPPYGATSLRSLALTARAGYTTVLWSRDSDDCRTYSPDEVVSRLAPAELAPGEIVLLHEGQEWTLEALPRILENLAKGGWSAVPVGEMI
jgi:peptidoglycan/xylan/chitin deacetylase (PgdA/CDA1 family)/glycosyltransferase involved in cell wall biosynthesis